MQTVQPVVKFVLPEEYYPEIPEIRIVCTGKRPIFSSTSLFRYASIRAQYSLLSIMKV